jgi:hypothetical protein
VLLKANELPSIADHNDLVTPCILFCDASTHQVCKLDETNIAVPLRKFERSNAEKVHNTLASDCCSKLEETVKCAGQVRGSGGFFYRRAITVAMHSPTNALAIPLTEINIALGSVAELLGRHG